MKPTLVTLRTGLAAAFASLLLAGCGLAETSATAVTEAKAASEQAKEGKELESKVQRDIEASEQARADALKKAEEQAAQ